jgi:predicted enzyme related to lactoylglutathione lyase
MPEITRYLQGQFSWADLMTPSIDDSKRFYSGLFGWDTRDQPLPPPMGGAYTTCTVRGRAVVGMGPQPPQMKGAPAVWSCYVNVEDVDAIAARVVKNGGKVVMPPMDVMSEGRMLTIQDPSGAMLGCWQPKNHNGAQLQNEPSTLSWFELLTRDVPKAKSFFSAVFGWRFKDSPEYSEMHLGELAIGGMMTMPAEMPASVPPYWSPYFTVVDVAATCAKASQLGGSIFMPPTEIPNVGTFAVIGDPQGGTFNVITLRN